MPRKNTSLRKILDAAGEEFSATGYHLTSMDGIAARAGVAKGTLYYNFPTKAALFNAVIEDGMEYLMGEVTRSLESDASVGVQIREVVRLHLSLFAEHPQIVRIMFNEISGGLDSEVRDYVSRLRARYVAFFSRLIELAAAEGVVRETNRQALSRVLIDLLYSTANYLADNPGSTSVDEMAGFLDVFLFDGVFRRSGS